LKNIFRLLSAILIFSLSSCHTPLEVTLEMSSQEIIKLATKGNKRAIITVGIVQNEEMSFTVYGENGKVLSNREYTYEIASITKTFTGQLFAKAISEGKVSLDDTIDRFLDLPSKKYYPTIRRLLTHTSGYKYAYYHGSGTITEPTANFETFGGGVTKKMFLNTIGTINLENRDYPFVYSNFGISVAGLVLEKIYNEDFTLLMNRYCSKELGLHKTKVNDGSVDVSNFWAWSKGNPYIPCGALISTITDMMKYAQMQINGLPSYVSIAHTKLTQVDPPHEISDNDFDIINDAMGMGWMIDSAYNIIHHGGNTSYTNSFLGFDKENRVAVVVLVNMPGAQSRNIGSAIFRELRR